MDPQDEGSHENRLNTRTFAIRHGGRIYVVVPVLVYEAGGDPRQGDGFDHMSRMFTTEAVEPFQALEIQGAWCTLDPHNSRARDPHQADDLPQMPHQAGPGVGGDEDPDNG